MRQTTPAWQQRWRHHQRAEKSHLPLQEQKKRAMPWMRWWWRSGGDRWRLSPAFDINPSPSRHRVLETGIVQGGSFDASLDVALEASAFFDLAPADAKRQAIEMARAIASKWKQALRNEGASSKDIQTYANAFEHTEAEKALNLKPAPPSKV